MTQGVTQISRDVYQLHMAIFYICCAIALVVFGLMFWAMVRHRKARGVTPQQFHGSLKVELLSPQLHTKLLTAATLVKHSTCLPQSWALKFGL
jgi:cytochrome c oxidase subunit 2